MNICKECKYQQEYTGKCQNPYYVLEHCKFLRDPIEGYWNSVDCHLYNANGKCNRYEKAKICGVHLLMGALVLLLFLLILGMGISIGQHTI